MRSATSRSLGPDPGDDGVSLVTPDPAASEAPDHVILEWLTDAHFTVDEGWRFLDVSPRANEFLGFPQTALVGRVLWEVFPAALGTPFESESRAAMQSRKPRRLEGYSLERLGLSTDVLFYPDARGVRVYYRVLQDVSQQHKAEQALEELNQTLEQRVAERTAEVQQLADELRALAAELTRVEQRERRRLALILHDHVQQLLVAAKMQVEAIGRSASPGPLTSAVDRTSSILRDAIAASRTLSIELSPPILHQSGLAAGLAWLAEHFEEKHGFGVRFLDESQGEPATEEVRLLLFESTRELLFNCLKHAGVQEARVTLSRRKSGGVKLTVEDEGCGFAPVHSPRSTNRRSLGLFSIQQRLAYCGGRMEIESVPDAGVRVTLIAPRAV